GEYDLAGFCVGAVERAELIDGSRIAAGDALIGIASSGPHSNGYSLIRKVLDLAGDADIDGRPAVEALFEPTRIYVKSILGLMTSVTIKGLAHITGGGISENLPRVLPQDLHAAVDSSSWKQGPVFDWLAEHGNIETAEMRRTFNCGVGMIVVVENSELTNALSALEGLGESARRIGQVVVGAGPVQYL
ncbi:MAG: phosphoribosylformylglycinamidine cyclo-ligase, partial [Gammaproteobacteria bacterium]|nr:phosphoribosylformylglycinamidine cyclo-ligase [Gammaproteobacteria bacterium]